MVVLVDVVVVVIVIRKRQVLDQYILQRAGNRPINVGNIDRFFPTTTATVTTSNNGAVIAKEAPIDGGTFGI